MCLSFQSLARALGGVLALLAGAAPLASQVKLSGPLPREVAGAVRAFAHSPDGSRLVYVSDERTDDVFELFSVPADGSAAPLVLSGVLASGGDVATPAGSFQDAFAIAPDGTWVAFLADAATDGVFELFRVPIDGSAAPVKVSGNLVAGGDVTSFRFAPDGSSLVFLADALVDERFELFRVPGLGTSFLRLSGALAAGGDVLSFQLGAQGVRVYYRADAVLDGVAELFSVPLDASASAVRLNDALPAGRGVLDFRVSTDESQVVFRADGASDDVFELYGVPSDRASAPVKLNPTPVAGGDVGTSYAIGGTRVAYLADQDTNDVLELYSAPLDGSSAAVKLHPGSSLISAFLFTLDASEVLFLGSVALERGLFRVPAAGGTPVRLSAPITGAEFLHTPRLSHDGTRIAYQRNTQLFSYGQPTVDYDELFVVPVAGGAAVQLTSDRRGNSLPGRLSVQWSADDLRLVYAKVLLRFQTIGNDTLYTVRADGTETPLPIVAVSDLALDPSGTRVAFVGGAGSQTFEGRLGTVELDGSALRALSGPTLPGPITGYVTEFSPTPDGLQVAYGTSLDAGYRVVGAGGGSAASKVVETSLPFFPEAGSLSVSPDGEYFAFAAHVPHQEARPLYCGPLRGPGLPVRIHPVAPEFEEAAWEFMLSPRFVRAPDRIVFASGPLGSDLALHVVPVDGSLPPTRLNSSAADRRLWAGGSTNPNGRAFEPTPDGARVVYAARAGTSGPHDLFSVLVDGSGAPVRLTTLPSFSVGVYGNWELTGDGTRVLFATDGDANDRNELYVVPVDGGAPALRLTTLPSFADVGTSVPGWGLFRFALLTPDDTRVVYVADGEIDEAWALYIVPSDASGPPVRLSGALDTDVFQDIQLTPDGRSVLFRKASAPFPLGVIELLSVPLDGSAAPTRLSGPVVSGGEVQSARTREGLVKFGQDRAVFAGDLRVENVVELFSVPLDGSAPPTCLSGTMTSGGDVQLDTILVSADGGTVLYRADQESDEVFELWRVPIDGSAAPVRVNLPLPPGGDVLADVRFLERGNRIVYRADQEVDERFELYTLRLLPRTPRGPALPPPISGTVTRGL